MKKLSDLSLYYQYLILYLLVAFIPATIVCSTLFLSYNKLRTEVIQSNQSALTLIQHTVDTIMDEVDNTLDFIENDSTLTKYNLDTHPYTALISLKKTVSAQPPISNIILHAQGTEEYFTSNGRFSLSDLEKQTFCKDLMSNGYSADEWGDMINTVTVPTFWPTNSFNSSPQYLYIFSPVLYSFYNNVSTPSRTVVILIDREYIQKMLLMSQTDMDENILILNSDLEVLHYQAPSVSEKALLQICEYMQNTPSTSSGAHNMIIDGEKNMLFLSHSDDSGLYYVRFLSEKTALHSANMVLIYILITVFVVLIIGIVLIFLCIRHSYAPIRSLADKMISSHPQPVTPKNELLLLEQTFDKIFENNSSLSAALDKSKHGLINQLLSSLILGKFSSDETFHNACKNLGVPFQKRFYSVCSILIETNNYSMLDIDRIYSLVQETSPDALHIEIMDLFFAGKFVFVVNSDSNDSIFCNATIASIQENLRTEIGLLTTIGVGTFYDSYEQIGKSYLESINALDYRMIYGKGSLITSSIYTNNFVESNYPTTTLDALHTALMSNNIDLSINIIEKLREYTKSSSCNLHTAKYICFDIFALLKKIPFYANAGYVNKLSTTLNFTQLTNYDTIDSFYSSLIDIIQNTIEFFTEKANRNTSDIGEEFVQYIYENCFSYEFQICTMAEHFSISSQYMRKLFRNHTGQGLSEYITNIRLERAMQLLRETNMPLQDITTQIGLTDVSGFIRLSHQPPLQVVV